MEKPYEFEKLMEQVHKPNRVNPEALATLEGTKITSQWKIEMAERTIAEELLPLLEV